MTVERDEMRSFADSKENEQWIWLAIDRGTREIAGVFVGSRDREGAEGLWNSPPGVYRQCAACRTDFWSACEKILHVKHH